MRAGAARVGGRGAVTDRAVAGGTDGGAAAGARPGAGVRRRTTGWRYHRLRRARQCPTGQRHTHGQASAQRRDLQGRDGDRTTDLDRREHRGRHDRQGLGGVHHERQGGRRRRSGPRPAGRGAGARQRLTLPSAASGRSGDWSGPKGEARGTDRSEESAVKRPEPGDNAKSPAAGYRSGVRIDLHTHSTASDGSMPPAELMAAASAAGLDVIGLTDHDTTAGWAPAEAALPAGLTLVRGAELSCRWYAVDPPIPLHLLAYLFDADHEGLDVSWDEVRDFAAGGTVGRPHLAQALIRRGLVGSIAEAFSPPWLGERYRVPKQDTDVFAALRLVREAGGVPVLAQPRATVRGRVVPDELIVELAAAGLFGLEADHPDHSPAERAHVRGLAADLGLVVTGSSDFHGTHKSVRLGELTTAPEVYERILAAAS